MAGTLNAQPSPSVQPPADTSQAASYQQPAESVHNEHLQLEQHRNQQQQEQPDQAYGAATSRRALQQAQEAGSFYGSWRAGTVERQVLQLLAAAGKRITQLQSPYKVFPLQQPALQWMDQQQDSAPLR